MNKKVVMPITIVLLIILIAIAVAKPRLEANFQDLQNMTFADTNLSQIRDGIYAGEYKAFPIAVEVEVAIDDHRITGIEIKKHDNGKGASAETIIDKVIENQTLDVDVVTGATYSSKVILKAIENALGKTEI